jgi:hypothetical protein
VILKIKSDFLLWKPCYPIGHGNLDIMIEVFTAVTTMSAVFWGEKTPISYLAGKTLCLFYRAQLINAV